jgi:hypothetical protein
VFVYKKLIKRVKKSRKISRNEFFIPIKINKNSNKKESLITKFIKETRKKLNECSPLLVLVVITSVIFF